MTTIKLKNGSGAPLAGDLVAGEPALDLTNKRLYTEDSGGTVIEVGTNPSTLTVDGDVGVGTTTPVSLGAGYSNIDIRNTTGGGVTLGDTSNIHAYLFSDNNGVTLQSPGSRSIKFTTVSTERLRIDASGNLLVGKTSLDVGVVGQELRSSGFLAATRDGSTVGAYTRLNSDGIILEFRKDGSAVGSIGTGYGVIDIKGGSAGLLMGNTAVLPVNGSGTLTDGAYDIGTGSFRFKDLYLSGTANVGGDVKASTVDKGLVLERGAGIEQWRTFINSGGHYDVTRNSGSGGFRVRYGSSTKLTLDNSGNLLVGTTDDVVQTNSGTGNGGIVLRNNNYVAVASDGSAALELNRLASDGEIANFRKDGTTVGSIGTSSADGFYIHSTFGNDSGLVFGSERIVPCTSTGVFEDGVQDLGYSSGRFKDLYLSGQTFGGNGAANAPSYAFGNDTNMGMYRAGNNIIGFSTSSAERMRIDGSGNLGVGVTSVDAKLKVQAASGNTTFKCFNAGTGSQTYIAFNLSGGAVATGSITTNGSTTAYNTSSDYRLKENVVPLTGATERVKQLNPSRFNFIADADTTVDGFLAHEVADVVPEAITGTKDAMRDEEYEVTPAVLDDDGNVVTEAVMGTRSVPDYQGIDQSKLVPLLVATIQELEARITALESN